MGKKTNKLPSRFQIGDQVLYNNEVYQVTAVRFTESKVYYHIVSHNKAIAYVDSLKVSPVEKQESK